MNIIVFNVAFIDPINSSIGDIIGSSFGGSIFYFVICLNYSIIIYNLILKI